MKGYNVIDPAGKTHKLWCATEAEKRDAVDSLQKTWTEYCLNNWISPSSKDPFSPENKVKLFQNSLAYFLIIGNIGADGDIVTDYKEIMRGKSEIPISSCPPCIEDALYGSGANPDTGDDDSFFRPMVERQDERAAKQSKPKEKNCKPARVPISEKIKRQLGTKDYCVTYCRVDTDNKFVYCGEEYRIDNDVAQYKPKRTAVGLLYDMDKILCVSTADGLFFFDMAAEIIAPEKIKKISAE